MQPAGNLETLRVGVSILMQGRPRAGPLFKGIPFLSRMWSEVVPSKF